MNALGLVSVVEELNDYFHGAGHDSFRGGHGVPMTPVGVTMTPAGVALTPLGEAMTPVGVTIVSRAMTPVGLQVGTHGAGHDSCWGDHCSMGPAIAWDEAPAVQCYRWKQR